MLVATSTRFNLFLILEGSNGPISKGKPRRQTASFVHVVSYCWLMSKAPLVEREFLACQSEHGNRRKDVEPPLIVKRYFFPIFFLFCPEPMSTQNKLVFGLDCCWFFCGTFLHHCEEAVVFLVTNLEISLSPLKGEGTVLACDHSR